MTFGWMNAMENIEFASRFDISPENVICMSGDTMIINHAIYY